MGGELQKGEHDVSRSSIPALGLGATTALLVVALACSGAKSTGPFSAPLHKISISPCIAGWTQDR